MAAESTWKPAYNFTAGFGSGYTTEPYFQDCEFRRTVGTFPASNQKSGGWSEFGVDIETIELRGNILIDSDAPVQIPFKTLTDAEFDDGMQNFAGKGRLVEESRRGAATGGYLIPFTFRFTGVVTVTDL